MDDEDFWELTAGLSPARAEDEAAAFDAVAAGERHRSFTEELRRVRPGELVSVVLLDGSALAGRITGIGEDWIRLEEVADPLGAARARVARSHRIRVAAVARVAGEAGL